MNYGPLATLAKKVKYPEEHSIISMFTESVNDSKVNNEPLRLAICVWSEKHEKDQTL